jgi:serine/threonine protein kinase
MNYYY